MIVAAFLRPYVGKISKTRATQWLDFLLPVALGLLLLGMTKGLNAVQILSPRNAFIVIFGLLGVLCMSFAYRPLRFGLGMAAFMLASNHYTGSIGTVLYADRSFFGIYRTTEDQTKGTHVLFHGTTIHGIQKFGSKARLQPTSY